MHSMVVLWFLIDANPICASNMKPEGLVGPNRCDLPIEELHLSCSVSYIGNIPPILQWKMEGEDTPIAKGIDIDNAGRSVMMNLTMSSNVEIDGALFTCGTTRSHHKQHSCTTNPVKINCKLTVSFRKINMIVGNSLNVPIKLSSISGLDKAFVSERQAKKSCTSGC